MWNCIRYGPVLSSTRVEKPNCRYCYHVVVLVPGLVPAEYLVEIWFTSTAAEARLVEIQQGFGPNKTALRFGNKKTRKKEKDRRGFKRCFFEKKIKRETFAFPDLLVRSRSCTCVVYLPRYWVITY